MEKQNVTRIWQLYEAGKNYNNRLDDNYYDEVETNYQFYRGNHWIGFESDEDDDLPKVVLNFVRRFVDFLVASLTVNNLKILLAPYLNSSAMNVEGMTNAQLTDLVNGHIDFLLEKFKMEYKLRDLTTDAAISKDAAVHFYFDPSIKPYGVESGEVEGEIVSEMVDGVNVMFGNPNSNDKEIQPYILVLGRDTVDNLRREAMEHGSSEHEAQQIVPDSEYQYQASDYGEIENEDIEEYRKCLVIYCYRRHPETKTIHVSKSTQSVMIFDEVDTELSYYPIGWFNWRKSKNTYHGISAVSELIDTQIWINVMASMIMLHLQSSSFPKIVYDINAFPEGIDNRVGRAIGVSMNMDRPVSDLIHTIEPAAMSDQIIQALEQIVSYFKDTAGISDASLGNISNPNNTSAIVAIQNATAIPLQNVAANLSEFMESVGHILVDMMSVYYGQRPLVTKQDDGTRTLKEFDFDKLKSMWMNVSCDITESTKYSETMAIETLSNLLNGKHVDFIQFLDRMPEGYIKDKQNLIDEIKAKIESAQAQAAMPQQPAPQNPEQPQQPNIDAILATLSPEEQEAFMNASPEVQQQLLAHAMGQM